MSPTLSPVDLDHLIAEVDRNAPSSDDVDRVRTAAQLAGELQAAADDLVAHFVELARNNSRSWADVGEALGVTRQAAMQRFVAPTKESALPLDGEIQEAFRAAKEIAIRHRHNFIGTEHLLLGLLESDNAATKVLAAASVSAEAMRRDLESRMSLGGSQAAARIPWTPYARKCADLAEQHAVKAGRPEVGTADWLAALLEIGRGAAADTLRSHGITSVDGSSQSARKKTRSRSA